MSDARVNHDIVVIGASAGGLEPLKKLLQELPADLPASLFVVKHGAAPSFLPEILARTSALPVKPAVSGAPIERGCVVVAPPGRHLLLHGDHILLRRGPRENMARPAVDPLFRSAACSFAGRVVGIVLSGALDDGTAGLAAIKRCGGLALVQDPSDAAEPSMPRKALSGVAIDYCVPATAMAELLGRLVALPAGETSDIPFRIRLETAIAAQERSTAQDRSSAQELSSGQERSSGQGETESARMSPFRCPECHGSLWALNDDNMMHRHGHRLEARLAAKASELKSLLLILLRSHEERAEVIGRMAEWARSAQNLSSAAFFDERARYYREDAALIGHLLTRQTLDWFRDHAVADKPA